MRKWCVNGPLEGKKHMKKIKGCIHTPKKSNMNLRTGKTKRKPLIFLERCTIFPKPSHFWVVPGLLCWMESLGPTRPTPKSSLNSKHTQVSNNLRFGVFNDSVFFRSWTSMVFVRFWFSTKRQSWTSLQETRPLGVRWISVLGCTVLGCFNC